MLEINNLFFPYELKILGVMVTNKTPLLEITFLSMMTIASFFLKIALANVMVPTNEDFILSIFHPILLLSEWHIVCELSQTQFEGFIFFLFLHNTKVYM